ncbi:hypothetical protein BDW22DRAFT_1355116 [Trametopsis cervina]|nr:hypothetical protein BDW22DRAFT_1355116 [Trametopsis cervina]
MLKRQRPSSPTPWSMDHTVEADIPPGDLYEPNRKRRRYFTTSDSDKSSWMDSFNSEGDGDSEDGGEPSRKKKDAHSRGLSGWQQHAGEYRDANSLLHDLHAEQRHRMIFAGPSSTKAVYEAHTSYFATQTLPSSMPDSTTPAADGRYKEEVPPVVESKHVLELYEDTNKFLGSLVLNRRRQLDSNTNTGQDNSSS